MMAVDDVTLSQKSLAINRDIKNASELIQEMKVIMRYFTSCRMAYYKKYQKQQILTVMC